MRISPDTLEQMIIYEDAHLLVCHKSAFLAVESKNPRQQDLVSLLKNRRAAKKEEPYIGVIHRLDQPVEGLLVFAKTKKAAAALSVQVRDRLLTKEYYAIIHGVPEKSEDTLIHHLVKDAKTNTSRIADAAESDAREARLSYQTLQSRIMSTDVDQKESLLCITLDTGRHHQIRVQFAAIGHPLVGDNKYGSPTEPDGTPLALCASRLVFTHPVTGKTCEYTVTPKGAGFQAFDI